MSEALDNPIWHALSGPHQRFAIGDGLARQYPRDMAPFAGIENTTAAAYADLAASLPSNTEARLFRPADEPLPAGWTKVDAFPMLQMIAKSAPAEAADSARFSTLSSTDVGAMLELVNVAKPGPFDRRTPELGCYVGVWTDGRLMAMAGERIRVPGYVELSGIATHPDARGQGLASHLTVELMRIAFARDEIPFLHVRAGNPAIPLYQRLGFETRRAIWVLWRKPIGTGV